MSKLLFILTLLSSPVHAEPLTVQVIRVLDGDTFVIYVPGIPVPEMRNISIRIDGINTPETHTKCKSEKVLGLQAKDILSKKILNQNVVLKHCKNDKFGGRWVCGVDYNAEDIAQYMLNSKLAHEYHGEKKNPKDWCPTL